MEVDSELNRVIEAIDKLRTRKNRPNLPGIARYLLKSHGFPSDKTISLLESLLAQNRVKEVVYKGNISYRNLLRWRQPNKSVAKKLETCVSSSAVVRTLKDVAKHVAEDEGVSEARLQAALIGRVDGAVTLDEVRNQIRTELDNGTISINDGKYFLGKSERADADPDTSDSFDFGEARDDLLENTNQSSVDSTLISETSQSSFIESSDNIIIMNGSHKREDESVCINSLKIEINQNLVKPVELPRKTSVNVQNICHLQNNVPDVVIPDKSRRIIKKKTIYDPSEFELTPLVKKNKKRNSGLTASTKEKVVQTKKPRGNKSVWTVTKITETSVLTGVVNELESAVELMKADNIACPKQKQKVRNKLPAANSKTCCICSSAIAKSHPTVLSCSLCLNIAHKDCVTIESFYIGSQKWRCDECKRYNPVSCCACEGFQLKFEKNRSLLMCDFCEEFYHYDCHYPHVNLPLPEPIWRCASCPLLDKSGRIKVKIEVEEESSKSSSNDTVDACDLETVADKVSESEGIKIEISNNKVPSAVLPTKTDRTSIAIKADPRTSIAIKAEPRTSIAIKAEPPDTSLSPSQEVVICTRHKPEEPIPTVDGWSVKQVSDYFLEKFGEDVAEAFLSLAIDGNSLKKLSRHEVTNDLGLQLGIAMKVLYYVKKIQLGTNLLQQLWA